MTTRKLKALEWALVASQDRSEPPAVLLWDLPYDDFASAPKLSFAEAGATADDFWDFVSLNRRSRQQHRASPAGFYGIVIGPASINYRARIAVPEMDQISFHTPLSLTLLNAFGPSIFGVNVRAARPAPCTP